MTFTRETSSLHTVDVIIYVSKTFLLLPGVTFRSNFPTRVVSLSRIFRNRNFWNELYSNDIFDSNEDKTTVFFRGEKTNARGLQAQNPMSYSICFSIWPIRRERKTRIWPFFVFQSFSIAADNIWRRTFVFKSSNVVLQYAWWIVSKNRPYSRKNKIHTYIGVRRSVWGGFISFSDIGTFSITKSFDPRDSLNVWRRFFFLLISHLISVSNFVITYA